MKLRILPCLALASLAGLATGQALQEASRSRVRAYPVDTAVAVTTDGFWIPDRQGPVPLLHIPAAGFPGAAGQAGSLARPALEWDKRTDTFLVSAGPQLFRVTVQSLSPPAWSVEDITPEPAIVLDLWDLDLHPASGELFLLDQTNDEVLRFARPFAAGMLASLVLPVPGTSRAMAVNSASHPPEVVVAESSQTTRVAFDGTTTLLNFFTFGQGLDHTPQIASKQGAYMVAPADHKVGKAAGSPNVYVDMNLSGLCTPLVLRPTDIEWHPIKNRGYVFADDGINPLCQATLGGFGPNHIVIMPQAQVPGVIVPKLYTHGADSGITGDEGDVTLVVGDYAYTSPYGDGCSAGSPDGIRLDTVSVPVLSATLLAFEVTGAAPNAPVQLIAGLSPAQLPMAGGCDLLVTPDLIQLVGTTDGQGELDFDWPLPLAPSPGLELFVQVAVDDGSGPALTEALLVHFGE